MTFDRLNQNEHESKVTQRGPEVGSKFSLPAEANEG